MCYYCNIVKKNRIDSIGYINAGGRGTRLNGLFTPNPETGIAKALLEIGTPKVKLVDHHIVNFQQQNIERVVVAAGDQSEVYDYIHDVYDDSEITVTRSQEQLGTGGDLMTYARESGVTDPIIIQNVDTILDINLNQLISQFAYQRQLGAQACIALTLNSGVPNEGAFLVDINDKVIHSMEFNNASQEMAAKAVDYTKYRGSSTGAVMTQPDFLRRQSWREQDGQLSLYSQTLRQAWREDGLYSYNNGHRLFQDVGTVDAWRSAEDDIALQALLRYNNQ